MAVNSRNHEGHLLFLSGMTLGDNEGRQKNNMLRLRVRREEKYARGCNFPSLSFWLGLGVLSTAYPVYILGKSGGDVGKEAAITHTERALL